MTPLSPDLPYRKPYWLEGEEKKERKEARVREWSERVKNKNEKKKKSRKVGQ